MKKRFFSVVIGLVMILAFMNISAFAAEISEVTVDYPNVAALVNGVKDDKLDSTKIKATLDGKELKVSSSEIKSSSTEWIILIDTSKSTKTYFEAEKEAVLSVYKSLGENDKLSLYTFDTKIVTVLNGSESKEDAEKKIKAIACTGQDTVFYEATEKLVALSAESKSENVISVIFSDGVDTISSDAAKKSINDSLAGAKYPVYGFYADSLKADTSKKFNELLAKSKGGAKAFSEKNATSLLSEKAAPKRFIISTVASSDFDAKENAELTIDLGDGKIISKSVSIPAWTAVEEASAEASAVNITAAQEAESTTKISSSEEKTSIPVIPIIAVALILVIAIILILSKKKKSDKPEEEKVEKLSEKKSAKSDKKSEKAENKADEKADKAENKADEKAKKAEEKALKEKKKKDEAQFQFYFVDKK